MVVYWKKSISYENMVQIQDNSPFFLTPIIVNVSFRFRGDRKSFGAQNYGTLCRDITPIYCEQLMIEAELARKYKI